MINILRIWSLNKPNRLFFLIFFIFLFFLSFLSFPIDDGLRHVGIAFEGISNWGHVYPFSYFSDYSTYSPWYGYDLLLRNIFSLFDSIEIQPLIIKFLFVRFFSLLFLFTIFLTLIFKSEVFSEIDNFQSLLLAVFFVLLFLSLFIWRSLSIRPFVFGTLFLIYSVGSSGYWRGVVSAGILIFFYPYLSWFYILPVAFSHFLIGDKKFAYGSLTIIILFLLLQPLAFWKLQAGLFASGGIRKEMEVNIKELSFTFSSFYGIFILPGALLFYPFLYKIKRSIHYCDLLIIVYLLPSIIYIRTFIDIFMPLAFVAYSKLLMSITKPKLSIFVNHWKEFIRDLPCIKYLIKHHLSRKQKVASKNIRLTNISLKPLLLFLYIIVIIFTLKTNYDQFGTLRETEKLLAVIPNSHTILSSFNQQYKILFLRPDLKVIPSSEIGMPSNQIRTEYTDFFKFGRFKNLSDKTGATYLIEGKDIYIDPRESKHLKFIGGYKKLKIWKIL